MMVLTFIREVLTSPALFLGLITLLGLLLQRKPRDSVIKGTIMSIVGYTLLSMGSNYLQEGPLYDFGVLFNTNFHIQGVIPNMEAISSLGMAQYGILVSEVAVLGMVVNLIMARYSPFRYIFLTGHHILYMACLLVVVLKQMEMPHWQIVVSGSILLGMLMAILPSLLQKTMVKVTKNDKIAYGHFSVIGCLLASKVAYWVRNRNEEVQGDIKVVPKLSFMKDSTVCIFLVMTLIYLVLTGVAQSQTDLASLGIDYDTNLYPNWIIYAITQGALFSGSIYVILSGVRMLVAEIVPAFKGIAKRVCPNAKPAVDCPIVFPYAPNAVMVGFLMSILGSFVMMLILMVVHSSIRSMVVPVVVPGVVSQFFCGGSAGAFAHAQGGKRGCLIGSFVHGLFISLLSLLVMPLLGVLNLSNTTFSDSDFCLIGILLGGLAKVLSSWGILILSIVLLLGLILYQQIKERSAR